MMRPPPRDGKREGLRVLWAYYWRSLRVAATLALQLNSYTVPKLLGPA